MLKYKVDTIKSPTISKKIENVSALFPNGRHKKGTIRDIFCTDDLDKNYFSDAYCH